MLITLKKEGMAMEKKHMKPFDAENFKSYVRTWTKVRMKKELKCWPLPPGFVQFRKLLDDEVFDVLEIHDGVCLTRCLCGQVPHTDECLTWPHLTVTILDPEEEPRRIHSFWLEPVEFLPKAETLNVKVEKDAELEINTEQSVEIIQELLPELSEKMKLNFSILNFTIDGIEILDAETFANKNSDFMIDLETGHWILGEKEYVAGSIVKTSGNSAILVLEGDVEFLSDWAIEYVRQVKCEWKSETVKSVTKALLDI